MLTWIHIQAVFFLGILNWGCKDKMFRGGGGVNMREAQIYIKKTLKTRGITLS